MCSDPRDHFPRESVSTTVLWIFELLPHKLFSASNPESAISSAHISTAKASSRFTLPSYKVALLNRELQFSN